MFPIMRSRRFVMVAASIVGLLFIGGVLLAVLTPWSKEVVAPAAPESIVKTLPGTIELADTAATRTQGLSGRPSIGDNYGMLFVFDEDARHSFWMKEMQFPIDIVWIDAGGTIVDIKHELSPSTYPNTFAPKAPSQYVLEVRAGYAREHGWGIGTQLDLGRYQK